MKKTPLKMSSNDHTTVNMHSESMSANIERTSLRSTIDRLKKYSSYTPFIIFFFFFITIIFKVDGAEKMLFCTQEVLKTLSNAQTNKTFT